MEKIYRLLTKTTHNAYSHIIFYEGEVVECVQDNGNLWFAKRVGKNETPRMLFKDDCRELTSKERADNGL